MAETKRVQNTLEAELIRMKKLIPFEAGQDLLVCWKPAEESKVHGEIKGKMIFVYDVDPEESVLTLKHEFLDFWLSKLLISPLMSLINVFIDLKTKEVYLEKERVVESLLKFVQSSGEAKK